MAQAGSAILAITAGLLLTGSEGYDNTVSLFLSGSDGYNNTVGLLLTGSDGPFTFYFNLYFFMELSFTLYMLCRQ